MPLQFHPRQGALVLVDFDGAFRAPEMVKSRPCVVVSKGMKQRPGLLTVVAVSTTRPNPVMPWHREIDIPFAMPDR